MWQKRCHLAATSLKNQVYFFVEKISESTYVSTVTMSFFQVLYTVHSFNSIFFFK